MPAWAMVGRPGVSQLRIELRISVFRKQDVAISEPLGEIIE